MVDRLRARFQVPLRREVGKCQAGKKGADDGGHADLGGHHGKTEADGKRQHERSIVSLHALQSGPYAAHQTWTEIDHEDGKTDSLRDHQAKMQPLNPHARRHADHDAQQDHAEHVVKHCGAKHDARYPKLQHIQVA